MHVLLSPLPSPYPSSFLPIAHKASFITHERTVHMPPPSPIPSQLPAFMWRPTSSTLDARSSIAEGLQVAQEHAAHLRALHAAVVTSGNNNNNNNSISSGSSNSKSPLKSRSPLKTRPGQRCRTSATSAACPPRLGKDYPVFTPSYEDFLLRGRRNGEDARNSLEWEVPRQTSSGHGLDSSMPGIDGFSVESCDSAKGLVDLPTFRNLAPTRESTTVTMGFTPHHITSIHPLKGSSSHKAKETKIQDMFEKKPHNEFFADAGSRKKSVHTEVMEAGFSCDTCKPVLMGRDNSTVVPLMNSRDFVDLPPKDRTGNNRFKTWFFRGKKKPQRLQKEHVEYEASPLEELTMEMDSLDCKVSQANQKKDAALMEVLELRFAMGDMRKKLEQLEMYCQNLKHALDKASGREEESEYMDVSNDGDLATKEDIRSGLSPSSRSTPTTNEFFHAVTEARVAVKQFCRTLVQQIQETDIRAMDKIGSILQSYNVRVAQRVSRSVRYHLESLMNQAFFEDFENVRFERNGTHDILDPRMRCHASYQSYLGLCKVGWNATVSKESSSYNENFDRFCSQKMSLIESVLVWDGRWPDELAHAFFVAARSVWLVHLLAFAYEPAATILRVGGGRFDRRYMEEVHVERLSKRQEGGERSGMIRIMVMPGFYVRNEIVRCKVLCRSAKP